MFPNRLEEQQEFCSQNGWANADLYPLPCDASKRTYTRLRKDGQSIMLMDAPPETENLRSYVRIGRHLQHLGIYTPEIVATDYDRGLALVEDFGDDTFTRLLAAGADEKELYLRAVDVLIAIQKSGDAATVEAPAYDEDLLIVEIERFLDWYVPTVRGSDPTPEEREAFKQAWKQALKPVSSDRSMLVVRDFHVDNLMIVESDVADDRCGLLDFQDALIGSPAYDLVSLVEDARRDVQADTRAAVMDKYFSVFRELDRTQLELNMDLLGAQRHTKVLGLFTRLSRQDNKHVYLKHIPRVAGLLARCLEREELSGVRAITETMVPDYQTHIVEEPLTSLYPK